MLKIDAHVSFAEGNPGLSEPRDNSVVEFGARLAGEGVSGCVAVSAEGSLNETDFLIGMAMEHPFIKCISGWASLGSPRFMELVDKYYAYRTLGAIRLDATDVAENVFEQGSVKLGCSFLGRLGKRLDLRIQPGLLGAAADFLSETGDGPVSVTLCTVSGDNEVTDEKLHGLCRLSRMPNVVAKLVAPWEMDSVSTDVWVTSVLDYFGADRCMMGTGYFVGREAVSYEERRAGFERFLDFCTETEQEAVLGLTALRFFDLEAS